MLKKILSNLSYLTIILALGFAIYYYVLSPNTTLKNSATADSKLPTLSIFASKLPNPDGIKQDLSQYKGKIIVLNFWATWCPPCREEMPELSELYTEYKNKNVIVLGVAVDELALVKELSIATPVSYPLFAAEDDGMVLAANLGNDKGVLPYTVIINQNGTVANTYFGRINKSLLASALRPLITP